MSAQTWIEHGKNRAEMDARLSPSHISVKSVTQARMSLPLTMENGRSSRCSFPDEEISPTPSEKSYYKFYQSKLRQMLTKNRLYHEQTETNILDRRQEKPLSNRKQSCREYMKHVRDKMQLQSQGSVTNRSDIDHGKRPSRVVSVTGQRTKQSVMFTITSANPPASEVRPKTLFRVKQPFT